MPVPAEAFLSHSDRDRGFATQLGELLERHGVPYWYSRRDIRGAQEWHDEIGAALARCDWFLIVLSPAAVESVWVKRELHYALRASRYDGRILPLFHQDCDLEKLSWTLPSLQVIDFRDGFDSGARALVRTWGLGLRA